MIQSNAVGPSIAWIEVWLDGNSFVLHVAARMMGKQSDRSSAGVGNKHWEP
jgi:hypothetical protein